MTTNLKPEAVLDALSVALRCGRNCAAEWSKTASNPTKTKEGISNATRSAKFLSDACKHLHPLVEKSFQRTKLKRRHIGVSRRGERSPGEWLLDGVWLEEVTAVEGSRKTIPLRIRCAMECESSSNSEDYFIDFSKLLVVSSDIKIFAAGLDQKTSDGAKKYIDRRLRETKALIGRADAANQCTQWFLAFWPSPLNVRGKSLWDHLESGTYDHLSEVILYHWDGKISEFKEVKRMS